MRLAEHRLRMADRLEGEALPQRSRVESLLERLHAGGTTVIVVTHDDELARAARRIVRMRDGRIEADERTAPGAAFAPR